MADDATTRRQADALDTYWEALAAGRVAGRAAQPPADLDPGLGQLAAQLATGFTAPEPEAGAVARARQRLAGQADRLARQRSQGARSRGPILARWPVAGLATAALLAVVAFGIYLVARPQPVSAQAVIDRAQATLGAPAAGGVTSVVITEMDRIMPQSGAAATTTEVRRWFAAPDRWRLETAPGAGAAAATVEASDGVDLWQYQPARQTLTIDIAPGRYDGRGSVLGFGQGDLVSLLAQATRCFTPQVTGSATVAGRQAYVVDLGPTRCPSASAPATNGRQVLWVDQQTAFILRHELYDNTGKQVIAAEEVTGIQYNAAIDPALFTVTPPAGTHVIDHRPAALPQPAATLADTPAAAAQPAPGATASQASAVVQEVAGQSALLAALTPLAQQAPYPLFVPADVPAGLAPRAPRLQPGDQAPGSAPQLTLAYVQPDDVTRDVPAMTQGIEIVEQIATYEVVTNWTQGATPVAIAQGQAWARRGETNADGTGTNSAVLVVRDGTLVSLSSFAVAPERLLELARSLQAVPGGHAALPNPTPPSVADARRTAGHPVFVPTWLPGDWIAEPPAGDSIHYHDAQGRPVLTVTNGAAGCCLDADPRHAGQEVRLPNGNTAVLLGSGAATGSSLLWWVQDGTYVALEGQGLTTDTLTRIAGSMSATAEPARVEALPAGTPLPGVPTATPAPAPTFKVLRPTYLPEPMTTREQVAAEQVVLGFAPQAAVPGQGVLTLTERPAAAGGAGTAGTEDPQATHEQIGGHDVIVIHRGADCTEYRWQAGGLDLVLDNPYVGADKVRYTCEQMAQVVQSVR